jgi:U4/U6 small nuclear ribonucleoprotein PRP4
MSNVAGMLPTQGGIKSTVTGVEVMDLTDDSLLDRQKHEAMLVELEAKKRAFTVEVPTLPHDVRDALRGMGLPVRLFGENLADIRDRLRMELARREILQEGNLPSAAFPREAKPAVEEEEQVTKYTRASPELTRAREQIVNFSLNRARNRLALERNRKIGSKRKRANLLSSASSAALVPSNPAESEPEDEFVAHVNRLDDECTKLYKSVRNMALEGSQYGDTRALSAICTSTSNVAGIPLIATGSWSGTIKLWDGSSPRLDMLAEKTMAHEDRIMNIAIQPTENADSTMIATVSIDLTAKLWSVTKSEDVMNDDDGAQSAFWIQELAHLKGHEARLSSVAFHPMGAHVTTTSFDHTWRLWDIESGGTELLLQDGHARETYGVGFHPDGSLCATTDFGGVVQVWDLRTGKSACHFLVSAITTKRILACLVRFLTLRRVLVYRATQSAFFVPNSVPPASSWLLLEMTGRSKSGIFVAGNKQHRFQPIQTSFRSFDLQTRPTMVNTYRQAHLMERASCGLHVIGNYCLLFEDTKEKLWASTF